MGAYKIYADFAAKPWLRFAKKLSIQESEKNRLLDTIPTEKQFYEDQEKPSFYTKKFLEIIKNPENGYNTKAPLTSEEQDILLGLLQCGADPNFKNSEASIARRSNSLDEQLPILHQLFADSYCYDNQGALPRIKFLLEKCGVSLASKTSRGRNPFYFLKTPQAAKLLLPYAKRSHMLHKDYRDETPLENLVREQSHRDKITIIKIAAQVVKKFPFLINYQEKGSYFVSSTEKTLLHLLMAHNNSSASLEAEECMGKMLVKAYKNDHFYWPDLSVPDAENFTCMHYAVNNPFLSSEFITFLLYLSQDLYNNRSFVLVGNYLRWNTISLQSLLSMKTRTGKTIIDLANENPALQQFLNALSNNDAKAFEQLEQIGSQQKYHYEVLSSLKKHKQPITVFLQNREYLGRTNLKYNAYL